MIQEQLLDAFPVMVRDEFTGAIASAYMQANVEAARCGSFAERAKGYFQHFFAEALLEAAAAKVKVDYSTPLNKARNARHLVVRSNNWQMTPHRVSGAKSLPNDAHYRSHYCRMNDMFADSEDPDLSANHSYGYVYLLHSGNKELQEVSLCVPDRTGKAIVYNEFLTVSAPSYAETEQIADSVADQIRLSVEQALKSRTG